MSLKKLTEPPTDTKTSSDAAIDWNKYEIIYLTARFGVTSEVARHLVAKYVDLGRRDAAASSGNAGKD